MAARNGKRSISISYGKIEDCEQSIKFYSFKEVRQRWHIHRNKTFVPLAEEDCFKKLNDMQADNYIGFPIRSIHPALSFTFTISACNTGKVFIWLVSVWEIKNLWLWHCLNKLWRMFRMETNREKLITFNMTCLWTFHTNSLLHRDLFLMHVHE